MKQFFIVLTFEITQFLKNKVYIISTLLLSILLMIIMFVPSVIQMFTNDSDDGGSEKVQLVLFGAADVMPNKELLSAVFLNEEIIIKETESQVTEAVQSGEAKGGFVITSPTTYKYIVNNTAMYDAIQIKFDTVMKKTYQAKMSQSLGLDYQQIETIYNTPIQAEEIILGKDGVRNFLYTYILIFVLYFMVIVYGTLIASGVASEKSNRAIEVLVTSAKPNCLIFGKVIAGALAGIVQFGCIILVCALSYQITKTSWDGKLDLFFHIPFSVISSFAAFGILGYLFYSFMFGAIGAMASKTEDINSSSTPITVVFVVSFMITMMGMSEPDSMILSIASYIPFSSFMAMFVRVAMGSVSLIEIMISLSILALSTLVIGFMSAKIYRMGTLRYGNPIKFKDAIKILRSKE